MAEWQTLEDLALPILKHLTAQGGVGSTLGNAGSNPAYRLKQTRRNIMKIFHIDDYIGDEYGGRL